eukprot:358114-Chlamydomonas_euryale.AAC.2
MGSEQQQQKQQEDQEELQEKQKEEQQAPAPSTGWYCAVPGAAPAGPYDETGLQGCLWQRCTLHAECGMREAVCGMLDAVGGMHEAACVRWHGRGGI